MQKNQVKKYYDLLKHFGFEVALNELKLRIIGKILGTNTSIWKNTSRKKYDKIEEVLKNEFNEIIKKYNNNVEIDNRIESDAPIWIYWAQGFDNAPLIVKYCVESIRKNSSNHTVTLLDDDTLDRYIRIDNNILEKYKKGLISTPHFADVIRFKLLTDYGGIWCDSTIFLSNSIDKLDINNKKFYTIKHNIGKEYLACRGMWTTFFIASSKENPLVSFVYDCLCEYWKRHDSAIDYLFLDSIISIGYDDVLAANKEINDVPKNNAHVLEAMKSFDKMDNLVNIKNIMKQNSIHKLTYKLLNGRKELELMKSVLKTFF